MINGALNYVFADNLGTPRSLRRPSDNAEVWRWWDSEPFGDSRPTNPTAGANVTYNLRFPGQQANDVTRYVYNWLREYDPANGRYLQADPIGLVGGLSRYAYVGENPVSVVDPTGLMGSGGGGSAGGGRSCGCSASVNSSSSSTQQQSGDILGRSMAGGAVLGAIGGGASGLAAGVAEGAQLGALGGPGRCRRNVWRRGCRYRCRRCCGGSWRRNSHCRYLHRQPIQHRPVHILKARQPCLGPQALEYWPMKGRDS